MKLVDLPPRRTKRRPSESPGDLAVGRGTLRDTSGKVVGRAHQSFMTTGGRGEATTEQVNATFALPDGHLTLQGVTDNSDPKAPLSVAVTGGTGRYDGARGTASIGGTRQKVTFEIRLLDR